MSLALDGSVHGTSNSNNPISVTLTTSNANDIIVVAVTTNAGPVTGISGGSLTWTSYNTISVSGVSSETIELWYAVASSALSSVSISVSTTTSGFSTVDAFGVSGANTSSPFDSDGGFSTNSAVDLSINTANANDFVIAAYRTGSQTPTAGTGWTQISGADFQLVEYQIETTTQTSLDAKIGTGSGTNNGAVSMSLVAASSGTTLNPVGASMRMV